MMDGDSFREYITANHPEKADFLTDESTDWQKKIYRIAIQTDHNVSVTGGKKVPFRASLGYNLDQATLKTGDNQRGNIDVSLSPKFFKDHLSINANIKGIYQSTNWANTGAIGNAIAFDPTKPVFDEHRNYWNWYSGGEPNSLASTNPLSVLYDYYNNGKTLRSIGNLQVDYKVHGFEDLRFNVNAGYDIAKTKGEQYNYLGTFSAAKSSPDLATKYVNYNRNTLLEAYADYNHEFSWCNLDVMAGYSWQHNYVRYDNTSYYNKENRFLEEDLYYESPTNAKEYYLISFFGRANFSVLNRYLFTVTYRADASSRFGPNNKWGHFPSAAFAWNIKEEGFLKNIIQLASVKVKRPYGRHVEDFHRLTSFIATANVTDLLADPTGSRRFIGIELTGPINVSQRIDYSQLYAQAIALLDQGETYWMDEEQTKLVMESNRRFKQLTAEEQFFYDCFAIPDSEADGQYLSATTIFQRIRRHAGASLRYGNASQFSRVLTNIEGLKHRRTSHGSEYLVKEL